VLVTAASVQDSVAGTHLITPVAAEHPSIRKAWMDGGYRQHLVEHAARLGSDMEIVQRAARTRGFTPLPNCRAVERTYGWLMFHRRLARDYETLPGTSRHGAPVRIRHRMPSINCRRVHVGGRPDFLPFGSNAPSRADWPSVRSPRPTALDHPRP
jgi:hypothetical protein